MQTLRHSYCLQARARIDLSAHVTEDHALDVVEILKDVLFSLNIGVCGQGSSKPGMVVVVQWTVCCMSLHVDTV